MIDEFNSYRTRMNVRIMDTADTNIKRFMALDTTTYAEGALNVKTKETIRLTQDVKSEMAPVIVKKPG